MFNRESDFLANPSPKETKRGTRYEQVDQSTFAGGLDFAGLFLSILRG